MTQEVVVQPASGELTGGDWLMAVISFFLTPIASIALMIYNFARSRRPQGFLYLGVLGVQIVVGLLRFAM